MWTGADGDAGADTLRYDAPGVSQGRIRYAQVAFMEQQEGGAAELSGAPFAAVSSGGAAQAAAWMAAGRVTRVWGFDEADADAVTPNLPATDDPEAEWYRAWCDAVGALVY